jgi:excisionase family DNA binding protein
MPHMPRRHVAARSALPTPIATTPTTTAAAPQYVGKLLLTPTEAGQALGVDRTTIYDLLNARLLASLRIGRMRRIAVSELLRFIAERERQERPGGGVGA